MDSFNYNLAISLLSLALSLYIFLYQIIKNRKNLNITISNFFRSGVNGKGSEILYIQLINNSREAITISRLEISSEDRISEFGRYKKKLLSRKESLSGINLIWTSDCLPLKIEGLGCFSGLLVSDGTNFVFKTDTSFNIKLFTNKGILESNHIFSDFSPLNILNQCKPPDM